MTETPRVRYYPRRLVDELLTWCEAHAAEHAAPCLAVGLGYIIGLNEHQMPQVRIVSGPPLTVAVPLARRAADLKDASLRQITLDLPPWLAEAATTVAAGRTEGLLFRPRSTVGHPLRANYFRSVVLRAAAEAVGARLSVAGLNASRLAHGAEDGFPLLAFDLGYAPSWSARLARADATPRFPDPA